MKRRSNAIEQNRNGNFFCLLGLLYLYYHLKNSLNDKFHQVCSTSSED